MNAPIVDNERMPSDLHSKTDDTPYSRAVFEGQIRECYGKVVYTHKTHEKCADLLLESWARIKLWQIGLSAVAAGGFIVTVFSDGKATAIAGAIISCGLLALNPKTEVRKSIVWLQVIW